MTILPRPPRGLWFAFAATPALILTWAFSRQENTPVQLWQPHLLNDPLFIGAAFLCTSDLIAGILAPHWAKNLPASSRTILAWALFASCALMAGVVAYLRQDPSFAILFSLLSLGALLRFCPFFNTEKNP